VEREQQARGEQWPDHGAQVVADALETERRATPRLLDRTGDQRVTRRRADPGAQPVGEAPDQDRGPGRGHPDCRFGGRAKRVAGQRERLVPPDPVRAPAGHSLDGILRPFRDALDDADDAGRGGKLLRQEER
jgi:hypothetical protein